MPSAGDLRQVVREELQKALQLPPGATATPVSQNYLRALQQTSGRQAGQYALPRDTTQSAFNPGIPLYPAPIDPVMPGSGRAAPRRNQYPQSWNLEVTSTRLIPWQVLRDAADKVSIMRACIEVRKATIQGLDWSFGIDSTRAKRLAQHSGSSRHSVTTALQDKYADDIDRLHTFWTMPDRINGWTFAEWIGAALEEQLVLDALSIYPHLTYSGDLHSFEIIDSTTIKPLLDHRGSRPQPPLAAFQQILYGFPRGEFEASPEKDVDAQFVSSVYGPMDWAGVKPTDTLIYKVRRRRAQSPYGFSCVEQSLSDADLWLKRVDWLRQEYAAGVTPEMIIQVAGDFTPEQLRAYEAVFNDELSGRTAERHRARFLPSGFESIFPPGMDEKFSPELDLHLIRLACANFDVMPSTLGFVPTHGLGGAGHQQGEQDKEGQRATKPTAAFLTDLINELSTMYLGMPPEVTFNFDGLDDQDEQAEAKLLISFVQAGLKTPNEARDELNLPRYDFPQADEPFLVAAAGGFTWLDPEEAAQNAPPPPALPPGHQPAPESEGQRPPAEGEQPGKPAKEPAEPPPPQKDESVQAVPGGAKKTERQAFLTFLAKADGPPQRPFVFHHQDPAFADAANLLAANGDLDAVRALLDLEDARDRLA